MRKLLHSDLRAGFASSRLRFARAGAGLCVLLPLTAVEARGAVGRDWLSEARTQALEVRYEEALASVDSALAADPGRVEARILRARIRSWQGKHLLADEELGNLLAVNPANAEARLAMAYSRYYQERFRESEEIFRDLLKSDSGNNDAREGLARVKAAAEALAREPAARASESASGPWRVDASLEYSAFSRREQPDWNQQAIQVSRRLEGGKTTVHGRVERYRQFELTDVALEAGVARAFHPRFTASLSGGVTPAADFRPEWRFAAEVGLLAFPKNPASEAVPAAWILAGFRRDAYETVSVSGVHPGLRFEWSEPWAVTTRIGRVQEGDGKALYGWSARIDGSLGLPRLAAVSGLRFWLGAADAPETVAGATVATVSTRTLFVGIGGDIGRDWLFNAGYARDDREASWIRDAVNLHVARRF